MQPPVRLGVRPQLLSTKRDRRHIAGVVKNCARPSESVVDNCRPLCLKHL